MASNIQFARAMLGLGFIYASAWIGWAIIFKGYRDTTNALLVGLIVVLMVAASVIGGLP